jgi:hypothetical protein
MVTFLGVNGHGFSATEADVVAEILALADGRRSEDALTDWIRQHRSSGGNAGGPAAGLVRALAHLLPRLIPANWSRADCISEK